MTSAPVASNAVISSAAMSPATMSPTAMSRAAISPDIISPTIKKVVRWIEWGLIFDALITNLLRGDWDYLPYAPWRVGIAILAMGAFGTQLMPTHLSLPKRRTYVFLGFSLLILVDTAQVNHSALFDLFIIKTCMLLPRTEAIVAAISAVAINFAQWTWQLPERVERAKQIPLEPFLDPQKIWLNSLVGTVTITLFVLLLGFVFVAEQRSRHRAEQLTKEVESLARKLERSRIARDIHDSLGHSLTTLDVQLALVDRYAQNDPGDQHNPKLHQAIKASQQLATQCLTEARQSLQTIRATNFDLENALRTLSAEMSQSFVINLAIQIPPLPQQLSYQLYLIAKEGLINAQKHARAKRVSLRIGTTDEQLIMTLVDDGCGFDVNAPGTGYGLQGIRERSQLLGGQLTVTSLPRKGTTLEIVVPLVTDRLIRT